MNSEILCARLEFATSPYPFLSILETVSASATILASEVKLKRRHNSVLPLRYTP